MQKLIGAVLVVGLFWSAAGPAGSPRSGGSFSTRSRSHVSTVTSAEAAVLFAMLNQDSNQIAFRYPEAGCHERATLMCARLRERQPRIDCGKIWLDNIDRSIGTLQVPAPTSGSGVVSWSHHVAVFLWRQETPETAREPLVLDPSLFQSPVVAGDWVKIQTRHQPRLRVELAFTSGDAQSPSNDRALDSRRLESIEQAAAIENEGFYALQLKREGRPMTPYLRERAVEAERKIQEMEDESLLHVGALLGPEEGQPLGSMMEWALWPQLRLRCERLNTSETQRLFSGTNTTSPKRSFLRSPAGGAGLTSRTCDFLRN